MRRFLISSMVTLVMLFSNISYAAANFTVLKDILNTAENILPQNTKMISVEEIGDKMIITYVDEEGITYYDLFFDMTERNLEKILSKSSNIIGSTMMKKSVDNIKDIVQEEYPKAINIEITTNREGVNTHYTARFDNDDYIGILKLNPVTGAIGEREYIYINIGFGNAKMIIKTLSAVSYSLSTKSACFCRRFFALWFKWILRSSNFFTRYFGCMKKFINYWYTAQTPIVLKPLA